MELDDRISNLIETAVKYGASRELIKYISADKIVVSGQWVRWKCMFGCLLYGNTLCCPPFIPRPQETKNFIQEYTHALLIGFKGDLSDPLKHHKKMQKSIIKVEKKAFNLNYMKAFAFSTGACVLCKSCILQELPKDIDPKMAKTYCRHKNNARPSMEAVGIDVFSTVKNAGLQLEVIITENIDKLKYFGLLLIE